MRRLFVLATAGLALALSAPPVAAEPPKIIAPLQADGYLWAAPPSPLPSSQLRFQFRAPDIPVGVS